MSNEITKQPALSKAASKALAEHGLHVKVGDTVIELSRGDIYRVSKITSKGVEIQHRWWDKYHSHYTHTAYPSRGVYQVMGRRCGPRSYPDKMWYFLYNPGDEIWPRSPYDRWHERKR
jgi:hypothetical protein